ncbi:MAG: zinc ribbon domain-containing protein [Syntrophobacteria bacterium]
MQKTLQLLIELQEIEKRIQALTEEKARAPEQIAVLKEEVRSAETRLEQQQEMLESARKLRQQLEQEVAEQEERTLRSKKRLLEAKSNKEYQALLKEIEDIGGSVREREDRIIEEMERAEQLQRLLQEQKIVVEKARRRVEQEGAQLKKQAETADALIESLRKQGEKLKPQIPRESLDKYRFLKNHRAGTALAPVNKGTCQVCHMNLPPQLFIDLQKNEQMLQCPNCQRIIYWVGHEAYQSASRILGEQE